jgi:hypothetical protein
MGGNLNAYNVLKQGGIAKADDYAKSIFMTRIIYHIEGKPWLIMRTKSSRRSLITRLKSDCKRK